MKTTSTFLLVFILLVTNVTVTLAQQLDYIAPNSYDISKLSSNHSLKTTGIEKSAKGATFNNVGTKFYTIGSSSKLVVQYALTAAYDLKTATFEKSYDINNTTNGLGSGGGTTESTPESITFNDTGSKMYIVGSTGQKIYQFSLATPYDISTATWDGAASDLTINDPDGDTITDAEPTGMVFNNNGTKLFISDKNSTTTANRGIYEYSLSTAYNISTASATVGATLKVTGSVAGKENNINGLSFNGTGTVLYFTGNSRDRVISYTLSVAYDLKSTVTYQKEQSVSTEDGFPQDVFFNNIGSKLYIVGSNDDDVTEYALGTNYDQATGSVNTTLPTQIPEATPTGITFNNDGSKMYTVGTGKDYIVEYKLSTPFDISTASAVSSLNISAADTTSEAIAFNNDGSRIYFLGDSSHKIFYYPLGTNYDISTAGAVVSSVVLAPVVSAITEIDFKGFRFNNDGTKLYLVGNTNDYLYEYSVSPAYDTSTATGTLTYSAANSLNITSKTTIPTGLAFNYDGTQLFTIGKNSDKIHQYDLSTAYLPSSATFSQSFDVSTEDTVPEDITLSNDGTKFYIVGNFNNIVQSYHMTDLGDLKEDINLNDGSILASPTITIKLIGDTFIDLGSGTLTTGVGNQVVVGNVPTGLTPVLTLSSNTLATLSLTGTANSHQVADAISNITFTFNNSAFTGGAAASVNNAVSYSSNVGIIFYKNFYGIIYRGPQSFDVDNLEYTQSFALSGGTTEDIAFNPDGSKMYVLQSGASDTITEYNLAPKYDVSTAVASGNTINVTTQDTYPRGFCFSFNGSKLYVVGDATDSIYEYQLTTPFDVNTASYTGNSVNVSVQDITPYDVAFSKNGKKMFVLGQATTKIYQYDITSGFDFSSGVVLNVTSFLVNDTNPASANYEGRESKPKSILFNYIGNRLYVLGNNGDDVNEYSLSASYDISAPTFSRRYFIGTQDGNPGGMAFHHNGNKIFVVGNTTDNVYEYKIIADFTEKTISNRGAIRSSHNMVIKLEGASFANPHADATLTIGTDVQIANIPAGLTPAIALTNPDGGGGYKTATLTFSGTATNHADVNDVASLDFTWANSAFSGATAAQLDDSTGFATNIGVNFDFCLREIRYENGGWIGGSGGGGRPNITDTTKGIYINDNATQSSNAVCECLEITTGNYFALDSDRKIQVSTMVKLDGDLRLIGKSQLLQTGNTASAGTNVVGSGNLYMDQTSTLGNVYQSAYWTSPVTTNGSTFTIKGVLKDGTSSGGTTTTSSPIDVNFTATSVLDGNLATIPITISGRWLAHLKNATDWTREIDPAAVTFNPGEGWNMKPAGAATFSFVGTPNAGEYTLTIGDTNLYLIGNPYPSALDAKDFIKFNNGNISAYTDANGNAQTYPGNNSIDATLYFYEAGNDTSHVRGTYTGGYGTYNLTGGTAFNLKTPFRYIPVGQAFFVFRDVANSGGGGVAGSAGTIMFSNDQRNFQVVDGVSSNFFSKNNTTKKTTNTEDDPDTTKRLRLGFEFPIDGETYHRQVMVAFIDGLTTNQENGYDGQMFDRKPSDIALTTANIPFDYVITGIQAFDEDIEIPVSVYLDQTRDVTFKIDSLENFIHNIYLKDLVTNTYYNLTQSSPSSPLIYLPVNLTLDAGSYKNRFLITFKRETLAINNEILDANATIFIDKKTHEIVVKYTNFSISNLSLINLLGQEVYQWSNKDSKKELRFKLPKSLKTAVYIVKVKTSKGILSKKIIVK